MKDSKKFIYLRPIKEEDIKDYIRWYTTETEWMNWDAPWEEAMGVEEMIKVLEARIEKGFLGVLEICLEPGEHIGWVSSYFIDGEKKQKAIGIDIPDEKYRGKGNGKKAFIEWITYLFNQDEKLEQLYTQTWSGNERMVRLIETIGFEEMNRRVSAREVRGKNYDALTYKIIRKNFFAGEFKVEESFI